MLKLTSVRAEQTLFGEAVSISLMEYLETLIILRAELEPQFHFSG